MKNVKPPLLIRLLYPKAIWRMPGSEKKLYLTFDDGPTPEITPLILALLEQYECKATFFCVGSNVEKYPEVYQNILSDGHSVGNHTHTHLNGRKTGKIDYLNDIIIAQDIVESSLFRPPYGKMKRSQYRALKTDFKIIMWDVLSMDYHAKNSREKCLQNVVKHAEAGSIIVFHDSEKAKDNLLYALPKTIEHFQNQGYRFLALE